MSFHDDAHILSKLGILESTEESPRKGALKSDGSSTKQGGHSERQKFVDVQLNNAAADDSSDSDILFDKDILLTSRRTSRANVRRRADSHSVRFLILVLIFFTAGLVNASKNLFSCSPRVQLLSCFWTCTGIVIGCYAARMTAFRFNAMLFFMAMLVIFLMNSVLSFNHPLIYFVQGVFMSTVVYGGSLNWFAFWRSQPRRILLLFLIFSSGSLASMLANENTIKEATTNVADLAAISNSVENGRMKRSLVEDPNSLPLVSETASLPAMINASLAGDLNTPRKPEVATGNLSKVKSKTEENEEKEKEAAEKQKLEDAKKNSTSAATTKGTTIASTTPVTTSTTTTTTTSTTTTTTSTTAAPSTTTVRTTEEPETLRTQKITRVTTTVNSNVGSEEGFAKESVGEDKQESDTPRCPVEKSMFYLSGDVRAEDVNSFPVFFGLFSLIICLLGHILCCLSCGLAVDNRIKKLEGASIVGLGLRLRIALGALNVVLGYLQQILHFHPILEPQAKEGSASQHHMIACFAVFAALALLLTIGKRAGTLELMFAGFVFVSIGEVFLAFFPFSVVCMFFTSFGLYTLWITTFLTVEFFVSVRSTIQLAYFLIAWAFGRLAACISALVLPESLSNAPGTLFCTLATGFLLVYASRHLIKARKLREILDNSGVPIADPDARDGEYFSLNNRANDADGDDEGSFNLTDEDDLDRSSMDSDFEFDANQAVTTSRNVEV